MNKEKVRNIILALYREDPNVVNDDVLLFERVWLQCGWSDNRSLYENLQRVPRPDSITRRRRELHQEGLIKYSSTADKERERAFINERDYQAPQAVSWLND